jgi:hypothetical protein
MIVAVVVCMFFLIFIIGPIASLVSMISPAVGSVVFIVLWVIGLISCCTNLGRTRAEDREEYRPRDSYMTPGLYRRDMRRGRNVWRGRR